VHNVGVYFRKLFSAENDYFDDLTRQHEFQKLRESNKPTPAFRTGIYLTPVSLDEKKEEVNFRLLRCSTNLNGPSENFRTADLAIVDKVNKMTEHFFEEKTKLNHVLAQVYHNSKSSHRKEKKATISQHSDKIEDMPAEAVIAFVTFYQSYYKNKFNDERLKLIKSSKEDPFDWTYDHVSVLTILRFKLKSPLTTVTRAAAKQFVKQFDVVLYPNSVFIMSLSTNRLYTHEIVPSVLPIDRIPIRMGYVVRCSNTEAVFDIRRNQTYLVGKDNKYTKLETPDKEGIKNLKNKYFEQNVTDNLVVYPPIIPFSLNEGDYTKPNL